MPCVEAGHVKNKTATSKVGDTNFTPNNVLHRCHVNFRVRVNCSKREKSALLYYLEAWMFSFFVLFLPYCEILKTQGSNSGNRSGGKDGCSEVKWFFCDI